jgi:hypothetical protein
VYARCSSGRLPGKESDVWKCNLSGRKTVSRVEEIS